MFVKYIRVICCDKMLFVIHFSLPFLPGLIFLYFLPHNLKSHWSVSHRFLLLVSAINIELLMEKAAMMLLLLLTGGLSCQTPPLHTF